MAIQKLKIPNAELRQKLFFMFNMPIYFAMFLLFFKLTFAFPPIAAEFYGTITINDNPAQIGTYLAVYDSSGIKCGSFTLSSEGKYGFLSCNGNDPSTEEDEGASKREEVMFYINGKIAKKSGNSEWQEGSFREVNLSFSEILENDIHDSQESEKKNREKSVGEMREMEETEETPAPKKTDKILQTMVLILFIAAISFLFAYKNER